MTFPSVTAFVERRLGKQVSALGLGVFRIVYGCVLFLEVAQLFYFRHFLFDPIPYLSPRIPDLTLPFALWLVAIACLILGAFTRPAAIANYAFTLVTLSLFTVHEYHHDYVMIGVNFLLMFLPVGRRLSIDRLLQTRRSPKVAPETVSILAYEIPVFVGIALVYFDSAIYKLFSPMWMAGLGLWQRGLRLRLPTPGTLPLPRSLPRSSKRSRSWASWGWWWSRRGCVCSHRRHWHAGPRSSARPASTRSGAMARESSWA